MVIALLDSEILTAKFKFLSVLRLAIQNRHQDILVQLLNHSAAQDFIFYLMVIIQDSVHISYSGKNKKGYTLKTPT